MAVAEEFDFTEKPTAFFCQNCGEELHLVCDRGCRERYSGWSDPGWSGNQLGKVAGIPSRTVQHWGRVGFLEPTRVYPDLRHSRVFDLVDALIARTAHDLMIKSEVARATVSGLVLALPEWLGPDPDDWLLFADDAAWRRWHDEGQDDFNAPLALVSDSDDDELLDAWEQDGIPLEPAAVLAALEASYDPEKLVYDVGEGWRAYPLGRAAEAVQEGAERFARSKGWHDDDIAPWKTTYSHGSREHAVHGTVGVAQGRASLSRG